MRCDVSDPLPLSFLFYCLALVILVVMDEHILTELGIVMNKRKKIFILLHF